MHLFSCDVVPPQFYHMFRVPLKEKNFFNTIQPQKNIQYIHYYYKFPSYSFVFIFINRIRHGKWGKYHIYRNNFHKYNGNNQELLIRHF